jgi:hypothetical protein
VSERRIEDAALPVGLDPRDREVGVGAVDERRVQIQRRRIQVREDVQLLAREVFQLVMLIVEHGLGRESLHRGKPGVVDDHGGIGNALGMLVEPSTEHLAEFGP